MASNPPLNIPAGAVSKVSIIDSTFRLFNFPVSYLLKPPVDGFEKMPTVTTWSFLIESSKGQRALFDLGVPPNWESSYSPYTVQWIKDNGWELTVEKDVADVLKENGVDPAEIGSIIWSHHHWDHLGDPSAFPSTAELVVGPGFKDAYCPGFPAEKDSPIRESQYEGRNFREIDFSQNPELKAGNLRAFDFFGDGSFYLLDTPGHAVGHLGGLARTSSNPDTFIFMGGDLCHHGGEIRPSPILPIQPNVTFPIPEALWPRMSACPGGASFQELNVKRGRKVDEPFFEPSIGIDIAQAIETIRQSQQLDANENVFFIFAHDSNIEGVVDLFPSTANDWKTKGWMEKTLWAFLADLALAAGPH